MSPEQRADRGRKLADAYRKRLGEGLAEPREEFLARHGDLREVLEPLVEKTLADAVRRILPVEPPVPEQIGSYRVLGVLGEGGMGTVYVAEQRQPFRRRVALKVIKLGMDSKEVLLRFEAERQALAMMEHDNIARVFDAGTTDKGQPYFAMEYVKGEPFTRYCDDHSLGLRGRLQLFCQVCSGVQHAHQKGVIHRDLTPRNVLVTVQDGRATPKIIDFGIARATDHRLLEKTLFTQQGKLMGVPEYMSPEQAGFGALDIDTRSDIYTLGVLLYETLIGQLPFSARELRSAGYGEMERKIREQDPPRPSTKLTGAPGKETADIAKLRGLERSDLVRTLRGDLDWITMRALEKDRTRRYQTALELAQDIERYIRNEPVLARPPTVAYRAGKFLRRYRVQVAALALVSVTLVAGIIASLFFMFRAEAQLERAEALTSYMLDEFPARLRTVGKLRLLQEIAHEVVAHYEGLDEGLLSDEGRFKAARGLDHVGAVLLELGDLSRARSQIDRASRMLDDLLAGDPANPEWMRERGRNRLLIGVVHRDLGDLDGALAEHRQAREILQALLAEAPDDLVAMSLLAQARFEISYELRHRGESGRALLESEAARDLRRTLVEHDAGNDLWQSDLATSHHHVGQILHTQGKLGRARFAYGAALAIRKDFAERDPTHVVWKEDLASSHIDLGRALYEQGEDEQARDRYRQALELRQWLASYDPDNAVWQEDLARTYLRLGLFAANADELKQALARQRAALLIREVLAERDPSNAECKNDLADSHHGVGVALQRRGNLPEALQSYRRALEIRRELIELDPVNAQWRANLAKEHTNLGTLLPAEEALQAYGRSVAIELDLVALDPADAYSKREVAGNYENMARVLAGKGDVDEAAEQLREAVALREQLASLDASNSRWKLELAACHTLLASVFNRKEDLASAMQSTERALSIHEDLVQRHPRNRRFKRDLARSFHRAGVFLGMQGDEAGALGSWKRVVQLREELVATDPGDASLLDALASGHTNVAVALQGQGDLEGALESFKQALSIREDGGVRRRVAALAAAFEAALAEPAFRNDLERGNLYHAARAAALASAAGGDVAADSWRRQAVEWLREDLRLRRARIAAIEEQLADAPELSGELRLHRDHIKRIRITDPDLESLRGMPGFAALFRE